MIGGGTLIGLSNLLTGISDFDQIIAESIKGKNQNVDMLVKDIYGDNSPFKDLYGDLVASSFAKAANDHITPNEKIKDKYKTHDVLNSLMFMISVNIGQLAVFSSQLNHIEDVYFLGNYTRNNPVGKSYITFGVDFMSGGKVRPLFLAHDGYLGAIGAFLEEFK